MGGIIASSDKSICNCKARMERHRTLTPADINHHTYMLQEFEKDLATQESHRAYWVLNRNDNVLMLSGLIAPSTMTTTWQGTTDPVLSALNKRLEAGM